MVIKLATWGHVHDRLEDVLVSSSGGRSSSKSQFTREEEKHASQTITHCQEDLTQYQIRRPSIPV